MRFCRPRRRRSERFWTPITCPGSRSRPGRLPPLEQKRGRSVRGRMNPSTFCIDSELIQEAEALVELLRAHRLTVITAESCTGGLISAALSHARGASDCLHGGFVVYTKDCKAVVLGVDRELLDRMGSVNAQVAHELVRG